MSGSEPASGVVNDFNNALAGILGRPRRNAAGTADARRNRKAAPKYSSSQTAKRTGAKTVKRIPTCAPATGSPTFK